MPDRNASASWRGTLPEGDGTMRLGSGSYEGAYSARSRFEEGDGTNPEELLGAALAGCFSMALSGNLGRAGFDPRSVDTDAKVTIERDGDGFTITKIRLETAASVEGIEDQRFQEIAETTKETCPVSRALGAVETVELDARLA
jgi:osmotically inducible protein OsmC